MCFVAKKSKGKVITRKPIIPSEEELEENSRSKALSLECLKEHKGGKSEDE